MTKRTLETDSWISPFCHLFLNFSFDVESPRPHSAETPSGCTIKDNNYKHFFKKNANTSPSHFDSGALNKIIR